MLLLPKSTFESESSIQLEAYRQWITACALLVSKHLNENVALDVIEAKARRIIDFETELAKVGELTWGLLIH